MISFRSRRVIWEEVQDKDSHRLVCRRKNEGFLWFLSDPEGQAWYTRDTLYVVIYWESDSIIHSRETLPKNWILA